MLLLAVLLLAFYISKPFLSAVITGALIAYLSYPLYKKTLSRVKSKSWAAFIVTFLLVVAITIPFAFIMGILFKEAEYYTYYVNSNGNHLGTNFVSVMCQNEAWLSCRAVRSVMGMLPRDDPDYYVNASVEKITSFIIENVKGFLSSLLSILVNFFVMIFVIYYLFEDGEEISARMMRLIPLKESHKGRVIEKFKSITSAVFYGNISTAAIQGILGAIGFYVLGVPSPLLWGMAMALFGFIPYVGTAIIWLPAALNLIFIGYLNDSSMFVAKGIFLILYGLIVLGSIEHFLKPKFISTKADVHPILVFIGILGGLSVLGFAGLVLGPLVLSLLVTFVEIYEEEKGEIQKYF